MATMNKPTKTVKASQNHAPQGRHIIAEESSDDGGLFFIVRGSRGYYYRCTRKHVTNKMFIDWRTKKLRKERMADVRPEQLEAASLETKNAKLNAKLAEMEDHGSMKLIESAQSDKFLADDKLRVVGTCVDKSNDKGESILIVANRNNELAFFSPSSLQNTRAYLEYSNRLKANCAKLLSK